MFAYRENIYTLCVVVKRNAWNQPADLHQILQMLSWFSRLLTSSLLAMSFFRPHLDYLHLLRNTPSSRRRVYFSVSLALELFVSSRASGFQKLTVIVLHFRFFYALVLYYGCNNLPPSDSSTPLPINYHPTRHLVLHRPRVYVHHLCHGRPLNPTSLLHFRCHQDLLSPQRQTPYLVSHLFSPLGHSQTCRMAKRTKIV
jgi:hypothetical protein